MTRWRGWVWVRRPHRFIDHRHQYPFCNLPFARLKCYEPASTVPVPKALGNMDIGYDCPHYPGSRYTSSATGFTTCSVIRDEPTLIGSEQVVIMGGWEKDQEAGHMAPSFRERASESQREHLHSRRRESAVYRSSDRPSNDQSKFSLHNDGRVMTRGGCRTGGWSRRGLQETRNADTGPMDRCGVEVARTAVGWCATVETTKTHPHPPPSSSSSPSSRQRSRRRDATRALPCDVTLGDCRGRFGVASRSQSSISIPIAGPRGA